VNQSFAAQLLGRVGKGIHMKKKAVIFGVLGAYLLLIAVAIYCLLELLHLNFTIALLTATSTFSAIMGVVTFLYRNRSISD
jgi:hypothetical protein